MVHLETSNKYSQAKPSSDELAILRSRQMADERLYRFFDERSDKEVREFGLKNMKRSIKEIRRLSEQVNKFCGEEEGGGKSSDPITRGLRQPKLGA